MLLNMFVFAVLISFIAARLEIEIEGEHGWAKNLPTVKYRNWLTRFIWGDAHYTGYHLWFLIFNFVYLHFPFFLKYPWSLSLELQIFAMGCIGFVMEDFFWFVFNPHYGVKKFSRVHIPWHHHWVLFLPALYVKMFVFATLLLVLSKFV